MKARVVQVGIFTHKDTHAVGDDEVDAALNSWIDPEKHIRNYLLECDEFAKKTIEKPSRLRAPGSLELLADLRAIVRRTQKMIEVSKAPVPWHLMLSAMGVARAARDLEANEFLFKPLDARRRSAAAWKKRSRTGAEANRAKADAYALRAFEAWYAKTTHAWPAGERTPAAAVAKYLKTRPAKFPDRQKRRLRAMLKAGKISLKTK